MDEMVLSELLSEHDSLLILLSKHGKGKWLLV